MAVSEEEQVRSMLEAMGVSSMEELSAAAEPTANEVAPAATAAATTEPPSETAIQSVASDLSSLTHPSLPPRDMKPSLGHGREVTVSTLVHLLGLPNISQFNLLESKIDVLTSKLATIGLKLERISAEIGLLKSDATVDRIDFQLNEIRAILKRIVPKAASAGEIGTESEPPKTSSSRARVLTSAPAKPAEKEATKEPAKAAEKDNLEEFSAMGDEAFQQAEGRRVRENLTKPGDKK